MSGCREPTEFEYAIDWLKSLRGKIRGEGIRAATEAVEDVASAQYARGQGPDGAAQPRRKQDGAVALRRPRREIIWTGKGLKIRAAGDDVMKYHRGKRPPFPQARTLTPAWLRAAEAALRRVLEKGAPK